MNPITIGMDVLLAGLLVAALYMGVRLNGRLKALKESHQGFALAVETLDAAAAKAESALKALHAASEDTHDSLLDRIETARGLALKLEKATDAAEKAAQRALDAAARTSPAAPSPVVARNPLASSPVLARTPSAPASLATAPAQSPRRALNELLSARAPSRTAMEHARPPIANNPPPASRRRPTADEDLFSDTEDGVRPGLSGLMRMSLARAR